MLAGYFEPPVAVRLWWSAALLSGFGCGSIASVNLVANKPTGSLALEQQFFLTFAFTEHIVGLDRKVEAC